MTLEVWYWLFMAFWLIFGVWRARSEAQPYPYFGGHFIGFMLFLLLGWKVFGSPIKG